MAETDLEWEERQLCADDACIGVIGPGNKCNVCGRPGPEGAPYRERPVAVTAEAEAEAEAEPAEAEASADFDDERELCADDACIGLIGPDGLCKECGKPRTPS